MPARGYALAVIPRVPLPRRPTPDLLRVPGRVRGRGARRRRPPRPGRRRRRRRLRRLRRPAGLPRRPAPRHADRGARGQRPRRASPTGSAPGSRPHVAAAVAGLRAARRAGRSASRCAREVAGLDRAAAARRRPRRVRARADGPVLLVTGGSQGAQRINERRRGRRPALAAAGVQVLHVAGAEAGRRRARAGRRRRRPTTSLGVRRPAWTSPTPPPTSRCAGPAR